MPTVVVIGGGISGLACARHIADRRPDATVRVFEASSRLGGTIHTDRTGEWICEAGPGSFVDRDPSTRRLIERLGLADEVVAAGNAARRRFIRHEGRLHRYPDSPEALARCELMSARGRARMQLAPILSPSTQRPDWTVSQFARATLGSEAASMLLDPIVGGIYAGDPNVLSARSVLPQLVALADGGGRVCDALIGQGQGRLGKGSMVTLSGGMGQLIDALSESLGEQVEMNRRVTAIHRQGDSWSVDVDGPHPEQIHADAVVVTVHGPTAAKLLGPLHAALDHSLPQISVAPVTVVNLGYPENAVTHPLDGFGYLVPSTEGGSVLGVKWTTSIFPNGRSPAGHVLMQVFVGGTRDPEIATDPTRALTVACAEVTQTLGISEEPCHVRVFTHPSGIPQYTVGHTDRIDQIETAIGSCPGLYLAGTALHGVGVNACTTQAERIAKRVTAFLPKAQPARDFAPLFLA